MLFSKNVPGKGLKKKFFIIVLLGWTFTSITSSFVFASMIASPNQSLNYFSWGTFDISLIVFAGLGVIFVPFILIGLLIISKNT